MTHFQSHPFSSSVVTSAFCNILRPCPIPLTQQLPLLPPSTVSTARERPNWPKCVSSFPVPSLHSMDHWMYPFRNGKASPIHNASHVTNQVWCVRTVHQLNILYFVSTAEAHFLCVSSSSVWTYRSVGYLNLKVFLNFPFCPSITIIIPWMVFFTSHWSLNHLVLSLSRDKPPLYHRSLYIQS